MLQRKPLTVNANGAVKRTKAFNTARGLSMPKHQKDDASVFNYARSGKQNSEGFGGGNRVGNRMGR